jgi:hypothetical protein
VSHFHIFGLRAWAHISTEKRKVLEPQSVECIFVGYPIGVKGYIFLESHMENFILARSVKFEEESLHDLSEDPIEEPLVVTDEEESKNSSRNLEKPSENPFRSDTNYEEKVMASPTQFPTWAKKTLQDAGELVGDPADTRRTRSQFFGDPQALATKKPFFPIHLYISIGSYPNSHFEAAGKPLWKVSMDEEYSALMDNNTCDLVPLPKGRKIVRCQWIYQKRIVAYGENINYKY